MKQNELKQIKGEETECDESKDRPLQRISDDEIGWRLVQTSTKTRLEETSDSAVLQRGAGDSSCGTPRCAYLNTTSVLGVTARELQLCMVVLRNGPGLSAGRPRRRLGVYLRRPLLNERRFNSCSRQKKLTCFSLLFFKNMLVSNLRVSTLATGLRLG